MQLHTKLWISFWHELIIFNRCDVWQDWNKPSNTRKKFIWRSEGERICSAYSKYLQKYTIILKTWVWEKRSLRQKLKNLFVELNSIPSKKIFRKKIINDLDKNFFNFKILNQFTYPWDLVYHQFPTSTLLELYNSLQK